MINADRNRFIKQHVELYGEELFLDSISEGFQVLKAKVFLSSRSSETYIFNLTKNKF